MSDPAAMTLELNDGHTVIFDADQAHLVNGFVWVAYKRHRSWYAGCRQRKGSKVHIVWMHRVLAATPFGLICHHRNRNTMDNRRKNFLNMPCRQHQLLHQNNSLQVKTDGSFVDVC